MGDWISVLLFEIFAPEIRTVSRKFNRSSNQIRRRMGGG